MKNEAQKQNYKTKKHKEKQVKIVH